MRKKWTEITKLIEYTDDDLTTYLESGIGVGSRKVLKPFIDRWNKLKRAAGEFDKMFAPVKPIEVTVPFEGSDFPPIWTYWKNYLAEQFGIFYGSHAELAALEHLHQLSGGNADEAIRYLKFAMAGIYPRFFKIIEKKKEKEDEDERPKESPKRGILQRTEAEIPAAGVYPDGQHTVELEQADSYL